MKAVVVGGGVGGLCAAIRLAIGGHDVQLFERSSGLGGKLASREVDGFHFDTGPSLLTNPKVFRSLFAEAGQDLDAAVTLHRLDPAFRYFYDDGSTFDVHDQLDDTVVSVAAFGGATSAAEYRAFLEHARSLWELSERTFFSGPMESPLRLLQRMRSPLDLVRIDAMKTLAQRSAASFSDPRLRAWANRYATYSGSSPWQAPATLACIPHLEQDEGAWHVEGGVARLASALVDLAKDVGVELVTNTDVMAIEGDGRRVIGVAAGNNSVSADIVVVNADAEHLYRDLWPDEQRLARTQRAGRSSSGFALLLGLEGRSDHVAHHNVWFSSDQQREFAQIFTQRSVPDDPTLYACVSSITDSGQAPPGDENWFVLVNVPDGAQHDWSGYGDAIIKRLGLQRRVKARAHVTPDTIAAGYRAPGGAIYGTSSNGRRSAFLRASNRGPLRGLYLASGSAHPGGGLPLVATSASIVATMIQEDFS